MSNSIYNFNIPEFQKKYGEDWDGFVSVMEDSFDYLSERAIALRSVVEIDRMKVQVIEKWLDKFGVRYSQQDSEKSKRTKLRNFSIAYSRKGMREIYRNIIYGITGKEPSFFSGETQGNMRYGVHRYAYSMTKSVTGIRFLSGRYLSDKYADVQNGIVVLPDIGRYSQGPSYEIFINPMTVDDTVLSEIASALIEKWLRPAFYSVYLVDGNFKILRRI